MKKIILGVLLLNFLPLLSKAQITGIHFDQGLTWQQVKDKAKVEHKYIFVDCFATWCGPCKKMNAEVFSIDNIGQFVNRTFISVKAQLDSTAKDDAIVKSFRADAEYLQEANQVNAFPTFLFFSPEGILMHKGIGFLPPEQFLQLARNATDPDKQYYMLVKSFREGKMTYQEMPAFVTTASVFNNQKLIDSVLKTYITNYLFKAGKDSIFSRKNVGIVMDYTRSSGVETFPFLIQNKSRIDSAMGTTGIAQGRIDAIIKNEDINAHLYDDGKFVTKSPVWSDIEKNIKTKYNRDSHYADSIVYPYLVAFHYFNKDWKNFSNDIDLAIKRHNPKAKFTAFNYAAISTIDGVWYQGDDLHGLNAVAFYLSQGCADKNLLKNALRWSNMAIRLYDDTNNVELAEYYDTKAILLYRLGQSNEAILLEEKAISMAPKMDDIKNNLDKIRRGSPTWPVVASK